ncbi:MAG: NUDIX domain-containing protein [Candidatus Nanohaloarchaea archaeon]
MPVDLRVAAIIFDGEKVLTTKMEEDGRAYHVLPGGGVEEDEDIKEALERELVEETSLEIMDARLRYIRELNLETGRGIEFYFLVDSEGEPETGYDPEDKEAELTGLHWLTPAELEGVEFHPRQLVNELERPEENISEVKHLGLHDYR